jgi:hypothetical protein
MSSSDTLNYNNESKISNEPESSNKKKQRAPDPLTALKEKNYSLYIGIIIIILIFVVIPAIITIIVAVVIGTTVDTGLTMFKNNKSITTTNNIPNVAPSAINNIPMPAQSATKVPLSGGIVATAAPVDAVATVASLFGQTATGQTATGSTATGQTVTGSTGSTATLNNLVSTQSAKNNALINAATVSTTATN